MSWNEANTFSKLIYPYLESLGYPERKSPFVDEQTYVRKRNNGKGPYDAVFRDDRGILVLVEAKKEGLKLTKRDVGQAFDYALGPDFAPLPPAFVLVSNGADHLWYHRNQRPDSEFEYQPCDKVPWRTALEQRASGALRTSFSLKQVIRLLKRIRTRIFQDLQQEYFPNGFSLKDSDLGTRRPAFDRILNTRKSYVDPTLGKAEESAAVEAVLSSIALSLTLKVLFLKIYDDLASVPLQPNIRLTIGAMSADFPGILKSEPYDALQFSDKCEKWIFDWMNTVLVTEALVFEAGSHNPVGDIFDGLVESEETDIQVKSLGNVYTPGHIVKPMVDAAERALGGWAGKRVLEPACGSGHFVREIYSRMVRAYRPAAGNGELLVAAHKKALEHIRAVDIDPFAVQTTQLGMFLHLCRSPGLREELTPGKHFDLSQIIKTGDSLDAGLKDLLAGFSADLVIGNPPYGVEVTETAKQAFGLQNNDSYGCFLVRGLQLLHPEGHLIFVVSSTFLTLRTHRPLRQKIFETAAVESVLLLHRNAFPGRDVFCCLIDLRKLKKGGKLEGEYRFCDAWPIRPDDKDYATALSAWASGKESGLPDTKFGDDRMPLELIPLRMMPPSPEAVERGRGGAPSAPRSLLSKEERVYPIVGGRPSLFLFCSDLPYEDRVREATVEFPGIGKVEALEVRREKGWVPVVKLWQIAEVRQGLATADDEHFIRKTPGVVPNARRRNLLDVDLRCTIPPEKLGQLTESQKRNGIPVVDRKRDKYFVPFDKGGEQDTAAGELRAFWSPVDYWIDWSETAVKELKRRAAFAAGTPKRPRFQNSDYYFRRGVACSVTGLYAPTFVMSFGGVFGHKANLILPFRHDLAEYLLVVLSSTLSRYFAKSFIGTTVDFSTDYFRSLPISVPTEGSIGEARKLCSWATGQVEKGGFDEARQEVDLYVAELYRLPGEDRTELQNWIKRRYPNLGREKTTTKKAS